MMRQEKTKFTWPQVLDPRGQNLAPGQLSIFPRISFMTLPAAATDFPLEEFKLHYYSLVKFKHSPNVKGLRFQIHISHF